MALGTEVEIAVAAGPRGPATDGRTATGNAGVGVQYVPHRFGKGAQELNEMKSAIANEVSRLTAWPREDYTGAVGMRIETGLVNKGGLLARDFVQGSGAFRGLEGRAAALQIAVVLHAVAA